MRYHKIPDETIQRLPIYLRGLIVCSEQGRNSISSKDLAEFIGVTPWQIRKDFSYFGDFGTRGVGYNIENLAKEIKTILRLNIVHRVALVGVGNLGSAVLAYPGLRTYGLEITAAFDSDAEKIGKELKETRSRAGAYNTLLSEEKQREERSKAAEAKHSELKQKAETIQGARNDLEGAKKTLNELEKQDIPLQEQKVQNCQKESDEAKAALEGVRKRRQAIDIAQETAEQARRFVENGKALADLNGRLAGINTVQKTLTERKRERADLVAPDARTLWAIGKAIKERDLRDRYE